MLPIFAHHDMLDRLDFLGLAPQTPGEHAVAFVVYAAVVFFAVRGGWWAARLVTRGARAVVSARALAGESR